MLSLYLLVVGPTRHSAAGSIKPGQERSSCGSYPRKQIPFRSYGLIPIAERKHHAKPRSRAVNFLIHNETTDEADRPIDWVNGVRRVRFNTLGQHHAAVRGPLLPRRLAVLMGSCTS
jgi:hypothetical protein